MRRERNHRVLLAVGGVGQARADVLLGQVGIILQNLLPVHPGGDPAEHVAHGDAQPPDARLAAALAGFNRDDLAVIHNHVKKLPHPQIPGKLDDTDEGGARLRRSPPLIPQSAFRTPQSLRRRGPVSEGQKLKAERRERQRGG